MRRHALSLGRNLIVLCALPNRPPPAPPVPPPAPAPAPAFPALSRDGDIYVGAEDLYRFLFDYHRGALPSRYVLYRDGTFGLQFSSPRFGFFEYTGRYTRAQSVITFDWDGWSTAGRWEASGTLRGDTLAVRYNLIMTMTDFVEGEYVRSPATR